MVFIYSGLMRDVFLVSLLAGAVLSQDTSNTTNTTNVSNASKRGLIFVPDDKHAMDNHIWIDHYQDGKSPLTWYSNYGWQPNHMYTQEAALLEFVPTFWSPPGNPDIPLFYLAIKRLMAGDRHDWSGAMKISHVMTFNEPEMTYKNGGSQTAPLDAAKAWVLNIIPLQKEFGIKAGLPATATASGGIAWIDEFLQLCSTFVTEDLDGPPTNCTFDFVSLHHFGSFEDLASTIGQYTAR